MIETAGSEY